jgi:hypothetical protein
LDDDGIPIYKNKMCIPNSLDLKRIIKDEIHKMPYSGHPSYQKTIATMRKQYFWHGMKIDVVKKIARCMK